MEEIKLRLLEAEAESQDSDENQLKKVCAPEDSAVRECVRECLSGVFPLSGVHPPRWGAGRVAPIVVTMQIIGPRWCSARSRMIARG